MTEPARSAPNGVPASSAPGGEPARSAARPTGADRRPVHVVVALGLTAGLYAVTLAGVTALQAEAEGQVAADRAPTADAVARLKDGHDALERRLADLDGAYAVAAGRYSSVAAGIAAHEAALGALGERVTVAAGSAAALAVPSTRLPAVSRTTGYAGTKPAVNACTTASGKTC